LEAECSIVKVLLGCGIGDRLYALRRFKPTEPSAILIKQKTQERLEAAEALSGKAIFDLDHDRRIALLMALRRLDLTEAVAWAINLVAIALREADTPSSLVQICLPWTLGTTAESFDVLRPRCCALGLSDEKKVDAAIGLFQHSFLTTELEKGEARVQHVREVVDAFISEVSDLDAVPNSASLREFAEELHVACEALKVISDNSPEAVERISSDRASVRNILVGNFKPRWSILADALDSNAWWHNACAEYRCAALTDLT